MTDGAGGHGGSGGPGGDAPDGMERVGRNEPAHDEAATPRDRVRDPLAGSAGEGSSGPGPTSPGADAAASGRTGPDSALDPHSTPDPDSDTDAAAEPAVRLRLDADSLEPRLGWWDRVGLWFGFRPPRTPRERARSRAIRRGVLLGGALLVAGSVVKLPLLIESPGPTYNTIGEVDGQPLIVITGTETFPTDGVLDMTTVSVRGGVTGGVYLGEALLAWALPSGAVVPRESVYGPDVSGDEIEERNDQLFALSQSDSIAAAMGELGIPTEESVVVTLVGGGTPSDGIVQAGDVVVAVDGKPVSSPAEVGAGVRTHGVGETVELEVLRTTGDADEPERVRLEVVTEANPEADPGPDGEPVPYIGILVSTKYDAPFDIEFALENVGGPSAGMMFSLAMVDMLTEESLADGRHVAGTGTITPEGEVGPIGGIRQKLIGARDAGAGLFLAPQDNCDEVDGHEPAGLTVVPVRTLSQARDVIERWVDDPGATFATCAPGLEAGRG